MDSKTPDTHWPVSRLKRFTQEHPEHALKEYQHSERYQEQETSFSAQ